MACHSRNPRAQVLRAVGFMTGGPDVHKRVTRQRRWPGRAHGTNPSNVCSSVWRVCVCGMRTHSQIACAHLHTRLMLTTFYAGTLRSGKRVSRCAECVCLSVCATATVSGTKRVGGPPGSWLAHKTNVLCVHTAGRQSISLSRQHSATHRSGHTTHVCAFILFMLGGAHRGSGATRAFCSRVCMLAPNRYNEQVARKVCERTRARASTPKGLCI